MRIIGGIHRGRQLKVPEGRDIRPTSDKVRQAVFNMLTARGVVKEANVLDAFCGTGALGLEALSQGAAFCVFIDSAKKALGLCQKNISMLKMEMCGKTIQADSAKLGQKPETIPAADLVFLDPPYNKELISPALKALQTGNWVHPDTVCAIELSSKEKFSGESLTIIQDKIYGDTRIILAHMAPE